MTNLTDEEELLSNRVDSAIAAAREDAGIISTLKYFWFMSPFGMIFNNEKHRLVWIITRAQLCKLGN